MKKKILGICGSTRKNGTDFAVRKSLAILEEEFGCETYFYSVRGKKINPCIHCNRCVKEEKTYCPVYEEDDMTEIYERFYNCDGIVIGSPVFEMGMSPQLSAILSRFRPNYLILKKDPNYFYDKVGIAMAVGGTRNGGQEVTINSIQGFYHTSGIIPLGASMGVYAGASIWSQDITPFTEETDTVGMNNVTKLTRKMGKTMELIKK